MVSHQTRDSCCSYNMNHESCDNELESPLRDTEGVAAALLLCECLEEQKIAQELVMDLYIHIDNSTIKFIVIEPNVLDLEDPRLIDITQYFSI